MKIKHFETVVYVSVQELYDCNGADGFNELLDFKLGHLSNDMTWRVLDVSGEYIRIRVRGEKVPDSGEENDLDLTEVVDAYDPQDNGNQPS